MEKFINFAGIPAKKEIETVGSSAFDSIVENVMPKVDFCINPEKCRTLDYANTEKGGGYLPSYELLELLEEYSPNSKEVGVLYCSEEQYDKLLTMIKHGEKLLTYNGEVAFECNNPTGKPVGEFTQRIADIADYVCVLKNNKWELIELND